MLTADFYLIPILLMKLNSDELYHSSIIFHNIGLWKVHLVCQWLMIVPAYCHIVEKCKKAQGQSWTTDLVITNDVL